MEANLEQIRESQKESWNKFSPGWKKWDEFNMKWLLPLGEGMIPLLDIEKTDMVLDIAAGTGEPGLTIAAMVTSGKVIGTDIAEGMLETARENAAKKGIENYETVACDVSELPFEDNTFDAVSCRLGFMFFPDMLMAAKEMKRVLKPGGKMATAVWGVPAKNVWITAIMGAINKNMELPPPPAGAPGMFRCSSPGLLADLLKQAGFDNVTEKEISLKMNYGTKENYWTLMNEVAAPVVAAMEKADPELKEKIKKDAFETLDKTYPDGTPTLDGAVIILSGQK